MPMCSCAQKFKPKFFLPGPPKGDSTQQSFVAHSFWQSLHSDCTNTARVFLVSFPRVQVKKIDICRVLFRESQQCKMRHLQKRVQKGPFVDGILCFFAICRHSPRSGRIPTDCAFQKRPICAHSARNSALSIPWMTGSETQQRELILSIMC